MVSAHDAAAAQMEDGYGGLYALVWGEPVLPERSTTVWLTRPRGIQWRPVLDTVRQQFRQTTLWRRQMVLGPGKEFALIVPPVSMSPHQQAGRPWPSSACASMRPLIRD